MNYSKQRSLILRIVQSNPIHPTAEWVFQEAKKEMPSIGIATVYRNLNALVGLGELNRISLGKEVDRFDANTHEHYHLRCEKCGELEDLEILKPDCLENLKDMVQTIFNLKEKDVKLNTTLLTGLCNNCIGKSKNN